LAIDLLSAD